MQIWRCDKKKKEKIIGVYQPEVDGFEVLSIHQGTQLSYTYIYSVYACIYNHTGPTPLLTYQSDAFHNFVKFIVQYPNKSLMRESGN